MHFKSVSYYFLSNYNNTSINDCVLLYQSIVSKMSILVFFKLKELNFELNKKMLLSLQTKPQTNLFSYFSTL